MTLVTLVLFALAAPACSPRGSRSVGNAVLPCVTVFGNKFSENPSDVQIKAAVSQSATELGATTVFALSDAIVEARIDGESNVLASHEIVPLHLAVLNNLTISEGDSAQPTYLFVAPRDVEEFKSGRDYVLFLRKSTFVALDRTNLQRVIGAYELTIPAKSTWSFSQHDLRPLFALSSADASLRGHTLQSLCGNQKYGAKTAQALKQRFLAEFQITSRPQLDFFEDLRRHDPVALIAWLQVRTQTGRASAFPSQLCSSLVRDSCLDRAKIVREAHFQQIR